jgi:hypothetical protein
LGRESTAGSEVNATTIWRGQFASIEDARDRVTVEEQIGLLITGERTYDRSLLARLNLPATELTFEQVPHIFEAGIQTATPGGAGPYTYTYAFPTGNSVNTIKTYTIEAHNAVADADAEQMSYGFVEEFTLEADAGGPWMMSANWVGRQTVTKAPTSLSTLLTTEVATLMRTKLYIDATGGTVGTTPETGTLMGASMRVRTGIVPVMVGDGNLYFSTHKFVRPEITFSLTLELEEDTNVSLVAAERAFYKSNTVRLFKLLAEGATPANASLAMSWAGVYDSIGSYTNADGNTTVTLEGHAVYSSADALFWTTTVTNQVATLP